MITVVVVILVTAVIGGVVIVGLSVWWVSQNAGRMTEGMSAAEAAGEAAGQGANTEGCVEPALLRADECGHFDPVCLSSTSAFLRTCLVVAERTEGFCDGVPPPAQVMRGSDWIMMFCAQHGRPDEQGCIGVVGEIQLHCHVPALALEPDAPSHP